MKSYDVIVIGGGASGMMAAGRAAERGKRVLLLEKNDCLGKKLSISGGGRCNITNAEFQLTTLLPHYKNSEKFLYSPFSRFGPKDTFQFFESHGLPLKIEERKRAFPKSERASDVTKTLESYLGKHGVIIKTSTAVTNITYSEGRFEVTTNEKELYHAPSCILSTGGYSHPETGSTGDGFSWLKKLGHNIMNPNPSLVPLKTKEIWSKKLSGLALDDIKVTFFVDKKKSFSVKGRMLFTHFGVSGPMILNVSKRVRELLHEGEVIMSIDLFPKEDIGILEKRILSLFDAHKNKTLKNIYGEFLPHGIKPGIAALLGEKLSETRIHSISKDERKLIARTLKSLPITITGLMSLDRAVVSDGGVPLTEVNMKNFSSHMVPGLFLCGDILNIDRPSGGYSLQLCWTSGYIAGESV